jgi:hypothetical protein
MVGVEMTDIQILTIVLASVPSVVAVLVGILINNSRLSDVKSRMSEMNSRIGEMPAEMRGNLSDLKSHMDLRFEQVDRQFEQVDRQFEHVDDRFDDMRDSWRGELRRVEEVIDARLKHLEEK